MDGCICSWSLLIIWKILRPIFFMLNKYPYVKQLFPKYSTMLPSSAHVERLFSFGGIIRSAKRNKLSDNMFETLLLLKANAHIN